MGRLEELGEMMQAAKQRMREEGKDAFLAACAEAFEDPKLERFRWTQYTPYFNDGDPCVFEVGEWSDIEYNGEKYESVYSRKDGHPECFQRVIECVGFLAENPDIAELAFGDHVEVIVSRGENGELAIYVSECDHD